MSRGPAKGHGGRPPKAPEDRATVRVAVSLTEAQAARLDELRGEASRSAYLAGLLDSASTATNSAAG